MTARLIMKLRVEKARLTSPDVLHVQLVHPLRPELPHWTAGAHVDLRLSDGRVRQYSLCGDPLDRSRYEIAIKRERNGRGGSIWAHENLRTGTIAHVSAPRNNLPLAENAKRHVLIAGGIGITPFASMARTLAALNKDYVLHYCVRSAEDAPLLAELQAICADRLIPWFSQQGRRFDTKLLPYRDQGTHVYVCGPSRLVESVRTALKDWPEQQIHNEVFSRRSMRISKPNRSRPWSLRPVKGCWCLPTGRCSTCFATADSSCRRRANWVSAALANAATGTESSSTATMSCRWPNGRIGCCPAFRARGSA
jgi:ferredoxin-NADP reductase